MLQRHRQGGSDAMMHPEFYIHGSKTKRLIFKWTKSKTQLRIHISADLARHSPTESPWIRRQDPRVLWQVAQVLEVRLRLQGLSSHEHHLDH